MTGAPQGLSDSWITPCENHLSICLSMSLLLSGEAWYGGIDIGTASSLSLMVYLMSEYSPIHPSKENALAFLRMILPSCVLWDSDNFGLKSSEESSSFDGTSSYSGTSASFGLLGRSGC